jgi:acyl-CoA synthetase (AMP-forming)/AMP-acid ligase II
MMNSKSLQDRPPFPFNLIEGMIPLFPILAVMGWAIVLVSLLVGVVALAPAQATFFSDSKAVREAAAAGSDFVSANLSARVIETWLPQFKCFGLGLGLMAITMALGTIAMRLRSMGEAISLNIREDLRPRVPAIPARVRVFQLSTLMGVMLLLAALVIGVVLATGVVPAYWNHSIANELDLAGPGSALLSQLGTVSSFAGWLDPLRMVGMAFLFSGITLALTVIIGTLRKQAELLIRFYRQAGGG